MVFPEQNQPKRLFPRDSHQNEGQNDFHFINLVCYFCWHVKNYRGNGV